MVRAGKNILLDKGNLLNGRGKYVKVQGKIS